MHISNKIKNDRSKYFLLIAAIVIFAFHQFIFLHYLNIGSFHFDFQSAFSRLTFGKIWFLKNGLSVPWFTPSICCGAPYFANPQSEFYSPIQLLFLFLKPLTTIKVTFFLYSLLSFIGSYLLLRNIFKLSINASLIGSTIFLFNHYFAFHFLSGHIGWGLFSIIPIFFYVSAKSFEIDDKKYSIFLIISSGIIFAIMMHSGGSRIIMEVLVSIFFLTLLHLIKYKNFNILLIVSTSVLIGLLISSSKIYAAWSFVEGLNRNVEPIAFKNVFNFIANFFNFFFLIPKSNIEFASISAGLTIEEYSFNISVIPLIILVLYLRNFPQLTKDKLIFILSSILFFSVLIIILLNFPNTFLGALVRKIPFISNDWISMRMLSPLIILFIVITASMFDQIDFKNKHFITILLISVVIVQNLLFDKEKLYKIFSSKEAVFEKFLNANITKDTVDQYKINSVLTILDENSKFDGPKQHDFFLRNESIQFCYFSVFGYDLEALKPIVSKIVFDYHETWSIREDLITTKELGSKINVYKGKPLFERDGNLNFINPACYLNPAANNCNKNYLFKIEQKKELIDFLNYRPFKFKHLKIQKIFNFLSVFTLFLSLSYFVYFIFYKMIKKNPSKNIS